MNKIRKIILNKDLRERVKFEQILTKSDPGIRAQPWETTQWNKSNRHLCSKTKSNNQVLITRIRIWHKSLLRSLKIYWDKEIEKVSI